MGKPYFDQGFNSVDAGFQSVGGMANGFDLSGTSDIYNSVDGFDGRNVVSTSLQVGSAVANGVSTFASAAGPGGTIAGVVLGAVGEAVSGGLNAYDAQKTIAGLKIERDNAWRENKAELATIIDACINKAKGKKRQGIAKASIIGQPGVMAYRTGRAIYKSFKGTKGVGRTQRATRLYEMAVNGSGPEQKIAQKVIAIICGEQMETVLKNTIAEAMKS